MSQQHQHSRKRAQSQHRQRGAVNNGQQHGFMSRTTSLEVLNQQPNRARQGFCINQNAPTKDEKQTQEEFFDCLAGNENADRSNYEHGGGQRTQNRRHMGRGRGRGGNKMHFSHNKDVHDWNTNNSSQPQFAKRGRGNRQHNQGVCRTQKGNKNGDDDNVSVTDTETSKSSLNRENKRIYIMRLTQLFELAKKPTSDVILTLVEEKSGFAELLNQEVMKDDVLIVLVEILCKILRSKIHQENQHHLMSMLLISKFFSLHVPQFISKNGKKREFNEDVLCSIGKICYAITQQMPESALEDLQLCVDTCDQSLNVRERLQLPVPVEAKNIFSSLQEKFLELSDKQRKHIEQREARKASQMENDDIDEDELEDFRQIPVIPTIEEIMMDKPLLRRNIIKGRYKNVDHYLDIHYRLLREDFIQPLRRGIAQYLYREKDKHQNDKKKKIKDIRVYENVHIIEPTFSRNGISYDIKFDCTKLKRVQWEISRWLIFGSLLCLSADNFKTVLFATVSDRKPENLKHGKLSVIFEDEFETQKKLTADKVQLTYTMVESQAYYEACKHILRGLQNIDPEKLPLQNYIIDVQRNMNPPKYLDFDTTYDISCISQNKPAATSTTSMKRPLIHPYAAVANQVCGEINDEHAVNIDLMNKSKNFIHVQNLRTWPSADELGLDDSQRKALHLALTSALTIIQGPPGTGKTYLGLKIVKVLLNNRHIWRQGYSSGPILVVCFTNHALDQFLEGMLPFTKSLVRVGSRSKNQMLDRYNIRHIRQRIQLSRSRPKHIFYNLEHTRHQLREIRGKWETINKRLRVFERIIIHEDSLKRLGVFGNDFYQHLMRDFEQHFELDCVNDQEWRPHSFLSAWLGLTLDRWVDEFEIEEFVSEEKGDFKVVVKKNVHVAQPAVSHQLNLNPIPDAGDKNIEDFIDIEDDAVAEEDRRILDNEIDEDLTPFNFIEQEMVWGLDVDTLHDPYKQVPWENFQDPDVLKMYALMGIARQKIAVRELNKNDIMDEEETKEEMKNNIWDMSLENRWRLYRSIIKKFILSSQQEIEGLRQQYNTVAKRMREVENGEELAIFAENDVIGMTTTGAAKYYEVLQELNPSIVVVEEAAEVLESHIVTSLAPQTQHLILIGDHQQLRPKSTVYALSKDYHLDISLFERMIKNEVHYETLKLQHRMRPEISRLLVPLIYDSLEDHPVVRKHPAIKGTSNSVYFVSHSTKEDVIPDSKTHSNQYEAEYLVAFCRYLLQQGYPPEKITILTTYVGQLYTFKNLMKRETFQGVRVASVDNFQGEENDVILLSFVRSNDDGKIGFLNIDNRVNVALSRARHGMFCIGNFKLFSAKSDLWRRLVSLLDRQEMIGDGIEIVCQKHPDSVHTIVNPMDFKKLAPEGGCLKICGDMLPCKHNCNQVCHLAGHGRCRQQCQKILCNLGHACPLPCYAECKPCSILVEKQMLTCEHSKRIPCYLDVSLVKCTVQVERTLPKCQHKHRLACHINPDDHKCDIMVERELPHCKHRRSMQCHIDVNRIACQEPCEWRLDPCGHQCSKTCHPLDDPDHLKIQCTKPCTKPICERKHKCKMLCYQDCNRCMILVQKELPCGHKGQMQCSESAMLFNCTKKCIRLLPCNHRCPKICNQPCGDCEEIVIKKLPHCSHSLPVLCSEELELVTCTETCMRPLTGCGHPCQQKCSEQCSQKCTFGIPIQADCGHIVSVPCHAKDELPEIINRYCANPCNKLLPKCEHKCQGTCGDCRQGRVHIPCKEKCERPLVCGHPCTYPCAQWCPPCFKKCRNVCKHSKCPKKCGQACTKCRERCIWQCRHKKCSAYCDELCDRDPCNEPCPLPLRCGHPCVGFCGEPCPPLCRICNFEELTEFILYGNETDEDARFVYLSDCKHTIEVEGMDHWMNMEDTEAADVSIRMKCCPRCQTTIWKCPRYGNIIRTKFKDIQQVKKKLFGSNRNQRKEMNRLLNLLCNNSVIRKHFQTQYEQVRYKLVGNCNLHQNATAVIENQIIILKRMSELKTRFIDKTICNKARSFADHDFDFLTKRLFRNNERIGDFEINQIIAEIERITLYVQMLEVENQCQSSGMQLHAVQNLEKAKEIFSVGNMLSNENSTAIKDYLEKAAVRKGLGISDTERLMIVKALDMTPGHWYKCPNGHVYAIGECGGAMEISRCNECGAQIGGGNHALLSSNAHAGEMDNSRYAAWSQGANMRNYVF